MNPFFAAPLAVSAACSELQVLRHMSSTGTLNTLWSRSFYLMREAAFGRFQYTINAVTSSFTRAKSGSAYVSSSSDVRMNSVHSLVPCSTALGCGDSAVLVVAAILPFHSGRSGHLPPLPLYCARSKSGSGSHWRLFFLQSHLTLKVSLPDPKCISKSIKHKKIASATRLSRSMN